MFTENKLLLNHKWDFEGITINDKGLQNVISLTPILVPTSMGRHEHKKFAKARVNIVERLVNKLMHFGHKYAKNSGRMGGKKSKAINIVLTALEIVHLKTGGNPIEYLVKAVENTAPNEDTTRIGYGGVVYHVSVDISPLRRVDLALRFLALGVRETSFSMQKGVEEILADEILACANNDTSGFAIRKKNEQERVAMLSR